MEGEPVAESAASQRWFPVGFRSGLLLAAVAAAGTFGGTLLMLAHAGTSLTVPTVVLAGLACLPLLAWHRSPLGVLAITTVASAVLGGLGDTGTVPPLGATVALYLLAVSRNERRPWTRRTTAAVVGLFAIHIAAHEVGDSEFSAQSVLVGALVWGIAWFAGERTRLRREQIIELKRRAQQAERDAERDRQLAAAEERARIARDLHDAAGHAINVIGVQAGAARLLYEKDPARSQAALQTIEQLARQTAADIDAIVGTLRGDPIDDEPDDRPRSGRVEAPLGLASLDTLLVQRRTAGLHVTLNTTGRQRPLPAGVDQAAFRILQEALTNAARHGGGDAAIQLTFTDAAFELTVTNPTRNLNGHAHGGHGLIGMRERATLLGGTLDSRRAGTTFRVRAHLPYPAGVR